MISKVKRKTEISPNLQEALKLGATFSFYLPVVVEGSGSNRSFREWALKIARRRNGLLLEREGVK